MKILLVLTRRPRDDTPGMRNALRQMAQAQSVGADVRIFLMNHAVCLAHERLKGQQECELQKILLEAISKGAEIKVCKTFITRCDTGYFRLISQSIKASMSELLGWLDDSDRVLVS